MENSNTEFIDIHNNAKNFEKRIESLKQDKSIIEENKKLILKFVEDCRFGKTIKDKAKKKISIGRCLKYISELKKLNEWFNKPFNKITEEDMERVIRNLEDDKYKIKRKGKTKTYTEKTKLDFKKDIKKFLKWMYGETEQYYKRTNWIDTHEELRELPSLTREEVEKLADSCKTREKAIIMLLFDSGARIGEFLNLRIGDLTRKQEENYFMIRIKHSKTKPRTIAVPLCTQILCNWLEIHPQKDDPNAQLFPATYDALRIFLKRLGKKVLKKDINPHLFRHSSATYYCHKQSQYQLCYRYGWSMSSKQPALYIDREGISEEETAEKVKTDDIFRLKKENQKLQESIAMIKAEQDKIIKEIERRRKLDPILDKIMKSKQVERWVEKNY